VRSGEGGPERAPSSVSPSSDAGGQSAGKAPRTGSIDANVVERCSTESFGYLPKKRDGSAEGMELSTLHLLIAKPWTGFVTQ
jgi:hypothetical protein